MSIKLPESRSMASGDINGRRIVLRGWYEDDLRPFLESQAAQVAALTSERDALRADAERLRIRGAAYEAAYGIAYQATYQSHNGHWDSTMQGGLGCRECIRAREARENCDKALREGLDALAARASLNPTTTRSQP